MNPSSKNLTRLELDVIAAWADRDLDKRSTAGDPIVYPDKWLAWRCRELEQRALRDPKMRSQLHRLADAWGIGRPLTGAYAPPVEDVPHPVATPEQVQRWRALGLVIWRLPADHWLRTHAIERLMEKRRPDTNRTEADEIRADAEALIVLAELEALIDQNADEVKQALGAGKPILKAMP